MEPRALPREWVGYRCHTLIDVLTTVLGAWKAGLVSLD